MRARTQDLTTTAAAFPASMLTSDGSSLDAAPVVAREASRIRFASEVLRKDKEQGYQLPPQTESVAWGPSVRQSTVSTASSPVCCSCLLLFFFCFFFSFVFFVYFTFYFFFCAVHAWLPCGGPPSFEQRRKAALSPMRASAHSNRLHVIT
jgi:hypothetical protein